MSIWSKVLSIFPHGNGYGQPKPEEHKHTITEKGFVRLEGDDCHYDVWVTDEGYLRIRADVPLRIKAAIANVVVLDNGHKEPR